MKSVTLDEGNRRQKVRQIKHCNKVCKHARKVDLLLSEKGKNTGYCTYLACGELFLNHPRQLSPLSDVAIIILFETIFQLQLNQQLLCCNILLQRKGMNNWFDGVMWTYFVLGGEICTSLIAR